jgi:hypothetical protein
VLRLPLPLVSRVSQISLAKNIPTSKFNSRNISHPKFSSVRFQLQISFAERFQSQNLSPEIFHTQNSIKCTNSISNFIGKNIPIPKFNSRNISHPKFSKCKIPISNFIRGKTLQSEIQFMEHVSHTISRTPVCSGRTGRTGDCAPQHADPHHREMRWYTAHVFTVQRA